MSIHKLHIRNYKCIKSMNVEHLRTFNLFAGKNSSGKTTLLEIIFLFLARNNPDTIGRLLLWRGAANNSIDRRNHYSHLFNSMDLNSEIEILLSEEIRSKTLKIKYVENGSVPFMVNNNFPGVNIQSSTSNLYTSELLELHYEETGKNPVVGKLTFNDGGAIMFNDSNLPEKTQGAFISSTNRGNMQEAADTFSKVILNKTGEYDAILKKSRIIEPNINDIQTGSRNGVPGIFVDLGYQSYLPIELLGDGMNRFFYLMTRIIEMKNGILLVDEIENGFHHSVLSPILESLITIAKQYNCQIFATTHNYELLQSLTDNSLVGLSEDISYYKLSKESDKHIVQHFDFNKLKKIISNNLEVR